MCPSYRTSFWPTVVSSASTSQMQASFVSRRSSSRSLTASSFDEQRDEFLALGCDDFLAKPFKEEALLQAIGQHLGLRYEHERPSPAETGPAFDVQRLAQVPPAALARLRTALEHGDVQAIGLALQDLRPCDADTFAALAGMAARFEFKRIRHLLKEPTLTSGEPP